MSGKGERRRARQRKEKIRREENRQREATLRPEVGIGTVAFLDILGFSQEVLSSWGPNLWNRIQRVRASAGRRPATWVPAKGMPNVPPRASRPVVQFFSDSIAISSMVDDSQDGNQAFFCMLSGFFNLPAILETCAYEGVPIRGCVESGEFLRSRYEIMGPAFTMACWIEKDIAKSARVLVGPQLLTDLIRCLEAPQSSLVRNLESALVRCDDGLIAVRPLYYGSPESMRNRYRAAIQEIREKAPLGKREKYDWVMQQVTQESSLPTARQLEEGREALLQLLEARGLPKGRY